MTSEHVYKIQQMRLLEEDFRSLVSKAKKLHLRVLARDRYGKEVDTQEIELDLYLTAKEKEV